MSKGRLEVHSENILPIIKQWLYSDRDIFIRELVSNACDAIQKTVVLTDQGAIAKDSEPYSIHINIDKNAQTLTFSDNGIGMTEEEIKTYIAQIAFSGAEEFVKKYKQKNEQEELIGHFGLGFYSAYMVASSVEIDTLSYKPGSEPAHWVCDGSNEYELSKGQRQSRGTTITLHISEENQEFLEEPRIREVLKKYATFLPYPIYLNGKQINEKEPLWMKPPQECTKEDYLSFYRYLYPGQEEPLLWMHLNVDYPFHVKGILYVPRVGHEVDPARYTIQLYCNRVFVADNCKDLIPHYLMALRGVIDSKDLPLNVSRSHLQMDKNVRQLSTHISKKVSDSLHQLFNQNREEFLSAWPDLARIVKIGAIEDDKFYDKVKDILIWQTVDNKWDTIEEYLAKNREKTHEKIYYTQDGSSKGSLLEVFKKKEIDVLMADPILDTYLFHTIEKKDPKISFARIDGGLHDILVDAEKEKTVLDSEGKTESTRIAEFIKHALKDTPVEVEAKSLSSDDVPAMVVMDEQVRRMRDVMRLSRGDTSEWMDIKKFVVNTNNSLVQSIYKLREKNGELAEHLAQEIYELTLLSQQEIKPEILPQFIQRTQTLLSDLVKEMVK